MKNYYTLKSASKPFFVLCASLLLAQMSFAQGEHKGDLSNNTASTSYIEFSEISDNSRSIYLNVLTLDTKAEHLSKKAMEKNFEGKRMFLIQFKGAIQNEWYRMMTDAGAEVIDYIPSNAYLVFADYNAIHTLQLQARADNTPIAWTGAYLPAYRINPSVFAKGEKDEVLPSVLGGTYFSVQLFNNSNGNTHTLSLINDLKLKGTSVLIQKYAHYVNIKVHLDVKGLKTIANQNDVISISPYIPPTKNDESQCMVMTGALTGNGPTPGNYLNYLASHGFTQAQFDASNFGVHVVDDGLDDGSVSDVMNPVRHFALYKNGDMGSSTRVAFNFKSGTAADNDTKACDGHGNINAHIIGGYVPNSLLGNTNHTDADGFRYGLGVAPFVKVGSTTVFTSGGSWTDADQANFESRAYQNGARISSNSWGSPVGGQYTDECQLYDFIARDAQAASTTFPAAGNQELVLVFSAGNSGSGTNTIGSPGTAKNVITVGAAEGVRAIGGNDYCNIDDSEANSANDIIGFSSRGPCDDGRKKPDIMAGGTHITGGAYPSSTSNPISGAGTADACFTGSGVCGGNGSYFVPSTQQWYTASSGTSHSCPAVSGFAALIRQDFINRSWNAPSPAMTKAMIMSSSSYMNGVGANDNLYSNNQGMGRVNMDNYFSALDNPHILSDQETNSMFTATGQEFNRSGVIANTALPVRITLAYSDAPGSTTGNAYVNNLDLEVTVGGNTYLGNVFTADLSTTGGSADQKNNVESVFLPAGTSGPISIKVKATNIAGNGVPNNASPLDQDFAIIASNITETLLPIIASGVPGISITAETCGSGLKADPNDHLTVAMPLKNIGTAATSNLVATLQSSGGIINPSAPMNYGALAVNASSSKNFSFDVASTVNCQDTITLTWDLTDGATNLGTVIQKIAVNGGEGNVLLENFDATTGTSLPIGWTQNQMSGSGINWTTQTTDYFSSPRAVFANNPGAVNATALESPSFTINGSNPYLTFQKRIATESTYDGCVLEIKIGSGTWTDIITAGGTFNYGGYNATISNSYSNPIGGRQAWTGYIAWSATKVALPASTIGQTVQLRWIMGSDAGVSATGFYLDDIAINESLPCATCTPMALDLLNFQGQDHDGYNLLSWRTANEHQTQSFDVEYALDGKHFNKAYTLPAIGSGNNSYQQRDNGEWISNNKVYYRLKMTDNDNKFKYSNIVTIENNSAASSKSMVYPNPTSKIATLQINDEKLIGSLAQILDSRGALLQTISIKSNITQIDLSAYATGVYMLKLTNGETLRLDKQ